MKQFCVSSKSAILDAPSKGHIRVNKIGHWLKALHVIRPPSEPSKLVAVMEPSGPEGSALRRPHVVFLPHGLERLDAGDAKHPYQLSLINLTLGQHSF